uniref:Uncharacterized protein n=1 Tax=Rhizophora mucronata TaxID=61149 RepID=A0A2P2KM37_RHIMU
MKGGKSKADTTNNATDVRSVFPAYYYFHVLRLFFFLCIITW